MQTALKASAMVLPGGRIEVKDAELPVGETVDVIVLFRQTSTAPRMTLAEVLAASPGPLAFQSADAVDASIREEREVWEHQAAAPKSDAEYEVEVDILLDKIKVMHEEIQQDWPEIDAIRAETKTNLASIREMLDEMDRRRNENTL